jgi:hypothetical protein
VTILIVNPKMNPKLRGRPLSAGIIFHCATIFFKIFNPQHISCRIRPVYIRGKSTGIRNSVNLRYYLGIQAEKKVTVTTEN